MCDSPTVELRRGIRVVSCQVRVRSVSIDGHRRRVPDSIYVCRSTYGKDTHKGSARILFLVARHFPVATVAAGIAAMVAHADIFQGHPSRIALTPVYALKRE